MRIGAAFRHGRALAAAEPPTVCRGEARVCAILAAGERELASMLVSGDVAIAARLFADDAVWSLGDGTRWTKPQALAALRNAPRMASSRLLRADVHQFGATAIVLWSEAWRDPASGRDERSFGTDTWMRRQGRWRIVASQEARPPAVR